MVGPGRTKNQQLRRVLTAASARRRTTIGDRCPQNTHITYGYGELQFSVGYLFDSAFVGNVDRAGRLTARIRVRKGHDMGLG